MQFWYRGNFFSGQVFSDLAPNLERDLVPLASPRTPPPGRFAVMINDRNSELIRRGALAFYHRDTRTILVPNRNIPPPILVHECFHASCHLNSCSLDTYDEELVSFVWQGIAEVILSGVCVTQASRLVPFPLNSAGIPVTGPLGASIALTDSGATQIPQLLGRPLLNNIPDAARPIARFLFENQIIRNDFSQTNITGFPLTQALARGIRVFYRQEAQEHAAALR
jgi:hypothetical protein